VSLTPSLISDKSALTSATLVAGLSGVRFGIAPSGNRVASSRALSDVLESHTRCVLSIIECAELPRVFHRCYEAASYLRDDAASQLSRPRQLYPGIAAGHLAFWTTRGPLDASRSLGHDRQVNCLQSFSLTYIPLMLPSSAPFSWADSHHAF
jgi:hypothetical protein